jgi:quercetin dioxygenase-like cupin family protein
MEWEALGTHGLRRKRLGYDAETGHTTNLVDIPKGWKGGGVAHFHHAFEEVYMLAGAVTVGGTHYWHAGDYFYRPAHVVHGHDEKAPEGATALIRSDGPLALLLIHDPAEPDEYPLPESSDARGHLRHLPVGEVESIADPALPADWRIKPLSADPVSGARTFIVEIPAGWAGEAPMLGAAWEACVLDGGLDGSTIDYATGDYTAGDAATPLLGACRSAQGCSAIVWQFGREG